VRFRRFESGRPDYRDPLLAQGFSWLGRCLPCQARAAEVDGRRELQDSRARSPVQIRAPRFTETPAAPGVSAFHIGEAASTSQIPQIRSSRSARWRRSHRQCKAGARRVSKPPTLASPFRPPVSTSGCDEALEGGVLVGVVGVVVVPEAPDDLAPGATEDACGVGVAGAAGAGSVVDVGGPGVVAAA
jgi:hypothetical protein